MRLGFQNRQIEFRFQIQFWSNSDFNDDFESTIVISSQRSQFQSDFD